MITLKACYYKIVAFFGNQWMDLMWDSYAKHSFPQPSIVDTQLCKHIFASKIKIQYATLMKPFFSAIGCSDPKYLQTENIPIQGSYIRMNTEQSMIIQKIGFTLDFGITSLIPRLGVPPRYVTLDTYLTQILKLGSRLLQLISLHFKILLECSSLYKILRLEDGRKI